MLIVILGDRVWSVTFKSKHIFDTFIMSEIYKETRLIKYLIVVKNLLII